ncbi:MAG: rod shape-determining protein MreD [Candidatus Omnitrophota bacterium]
MKKIIFGVALLLAALLQTTVFNYLRIFNVKPDLLLIVAVSGVFSMQERQALFFCLFCGLFKDIFASGILGINTVLFCVWGLVISRLSRQLTIDNNYVRIGTMFVISILNNIALGAAVVYPGKSVPAGVFLRIIILGSFYTTVIFGLISMVFPFDKEAAQND